MIQLIKIIEGFEPEISLSRFWNFWSIHSPTWADFLIVFSFDCFTVNVLPYFMDFAEGLSVPPSHIFGNFSFLTQKAFRPKFPWFHYDLRTPSLTILFLTSQSNLFFPQSTFWLWRCINYWFFQFTDQWRFKFQMSKVFGQTQCQEKQNTQPNQNKITAINKI